MPILPLPQFEADVAEYEAEREAYEKLNAPTSMVVRFGSMKFVGEFPYDGDAKPGCGSKMVVRTHRGTELGEMLTSTCPNAGCSKSVTRKEMLEYIENSGGRDYPFSQKGRVLRVATAEDMNRQAAIEQSKHGLKVDVRRRVGKHGLGDGAGFPGPNGSIKIVEVEPLLGSERVTVYFLAEQRVEFRGLVDELSREFGCRIEMRSIGLRDEARLTADYERCGQHCCCQSFLKVLKPVPMRAAKTQKATLEPLKISGRCGRLMCCLRYEDQTYEELKKRLPRRRSRVGTPEGPGIVIDAQILTQLVKVRLEADNRDIAVPVEELGEPGEVIERVTPKEAGKRDRDERRQKRRAERKPAFPQRPSTESADELASELGLGSPTDRPTDRSTTDADTPSTPKKKRRRRRKKTADSKPGSERPADGDKQTTEDRPRANDADASNTGPSGDGSQPPKKKRRRRRKPKPPEQNG
ncbi:MAG: regulatory iron-sulfur-containing complex subunit RicT [Planctomycetota bacterium]